MTLRGISGRYEKLCCHASMTSRVESSSNWYHVVEGLVKEEFKLLNKRRYKGDGTLSPPFNSLVS
jgi:hypothetical protein